MKVSWKLVCLLVLVLAVLVLPSKAGGFMKYVRTSQGSMSNVYPRTMHLNASFGVLFHALQYKLTAMAAPEPSSLILLGTSGLVLVGLRNRRKAA